MVVRLPVNDVPPIAYHENFSCLCIVLTWDLCMNEALSLIRSLQDTAGKHNRASKVEESVGGSAATLEDDGRWDFAKILSQDS